MNEKLIQIKIDENIKQQADEVFKELGLTTQIAIRIFMTQVAKTKETPFDNLFTGKR